MFAPSRQEVRRFFVDAWGRYRHAQPLEPLQHAALEIILLHPEYHALLEQPQDTLERDYSPASAELNPFLHLSLHLAVSEQLQIDQPRGICALFEQLRARSGDPHQALHAVLECLGETLWQAQRIGSAPDEQAYLECLRRHAGS